MTFNHGVEGSSPSALTMAYPFRTMICFRAVSLHECTRVQIKYRRVQTSVLRVFLSASRVISPWSEVYKKRYQIDAQDRLQMNQEIVELLKAALECSIFLAIIRAQNSDHEILHLREDGQPWTYEGFKTAWQREMNRPEFARFRAERVVFHGTRKNAVNNLLEVGCSEARVAAIVNMSPAMVHHYSKKVSQFRLARAAMEQFEAGWEKLRPSVLGNLKVSK